MVMLLAKPKKTVADYMRLPDQPRVELFEGDFFMSPSPNLIHQMIVVRIVTLLNAFVRPRDLGIVLCAPFDCILSRRNVTQPDVLFIAKEHLGLIRERLHGAPDLAVEVLSVSHAERDKIVKRQLYAKYGVGEFWIVDPDEHTVEVLKRRGSGWKLAGVFGIKDTLRSPILPGLRIAVRKIFD